MKSIIQTNKKCFICRTTTNIHEHHIYYGSSKRKISEKHGFKVYLCYCHHEGTYGVHGKCGEKLNRHLKIMCQKEYEKSHTREQFLKIIGKNYINEEEKNE